MISGHRWAAQYGQYSAPMYMTSGLPVAPVRVEPDMGLIRLVAVPFPTVSNSELGRFVMIDITCAVVSGLGAFGGSGVVYQRMTRNAAISTARPATTAAGMTHAGVPATGLRTGARVAPFRTGRRLLTIPLGSAGPGSRGWSWCRGPSTEAWGTGSAARAGQCEIARRPAGGRGRPRRRGQAR